MNGTWVVLALMLAQPGRDTVILQSGERVEGTVIEASTSKGITLRLPNGALRWFHPMAVMSVERAGEPPAPLREPTPREGAPLRGDELPRVHVSPRPEDLEEPLRAEPAPAPNAPGMALVGTTWFAFAIGSASPGGSSASGAPRLKDLVGPDQLQLSLEGGLRLDERTSVGAVLDVSVGGVGPALAPVCEKYGTDCSTAVAQLGLFVRRDFAPDSTLNPWASFGMAREWLAGEVFSPYAGGDSVPVLSAPGWQFARFGAGVDWRMSSSLGLGLYANLALGRYDRVTIDGEDVDTGGAVHTWAQFGVRGNIWP